MKDAEKNKRIVIKVDLDAIEENIEKLHGNLSGDARMAAVIKADGYGLGAVPIGLMLQKKPYIWGFCVATVEEALELKQAGITKPIMLLGYAFPDTYETIVTEDLRACVFDTETARLLSETAVRLGRDVLIHIAVDTGMSRIGFTIDDSHREDSLDAIQEIAELPGIKAEGLFTHFARADENDDAPALSQLNAFLQFKDDLRDRGVTFDLLHAANSAAIIKLKEAHLDLVRAGIAIYGMSPSDEVGIDRLGLKPAMSLTAHISYVKDLPAGVPISYGGTFVTDRPTRVATIPVGYADGYPRLLSNKGCVLIHGKRARILGRVCMDQFMVDVTEIPEAKRGDRAVLIGSQEDQTITAEEIGSLSGRFNYELVSNISKRVPRVYRRGGEIIGQVDYFDLR